jgi:hypothetical protein
MQKQNKQNKKQKNDIEFYLQNKKSHIFTCNKNLDFIVLLWQNFPSTHMWLNFPSTFIVIALRLWYLGLGA